MVRGDGDGDAMLTWFNALASGDKIAIINALVALLQFIALVATFGVMRRSARQQLRAYVAGMPNYKQFRRNLPGSR
jgi:hypothetical protein